MPTTDRDVRLARAHRYERLDAIASGGMGTVYLGRMTAGDAVKTVAIKVLHPHLAHNADVVAMFLDEARIATRMHHRNLVGVLDMDMLGEELVIVMEYVEGSTLGTMQSALRRRNALLPIAVTLRILGDALSGLHAMHELLDESGKTLGLVHRDVSPHNLLVGSDGITRVADFGVALAAGRLASTGRDGAVKGKLQYLAPEQVGRKALDRRVDIFAAGIVLWECLAGTRLFDAPTEAETVTRVLREPIDPPSLRRAEVPFELDEVCLRALERDPDRRFATAAEFARALKAAGGAAADASEVGALVCDLAADAIRKQRDSLDRATAVRGRRLGWRSGGLVVAVVLLGGLTLRIAVPPRDEGTGPSPAAFRSQRATAPSAPAPEPAPASSSVGTAPEVVLSLSATPARAKPPAAAPGDAGTPPRLPKTPSKPHRPFMPDDL